MKLDNILNNKNNIYFLHGPGTDKQTILDSIMNYGIRCGHGIFQFTSIYLGTPAEIDEYQKGIIEEWYYKNSPIVFIVSLPKRYTIMESTELNTNKKAHSAFYYYPTEEEQKKNGLQNKPHVYKEFVVGYYNSVTKEFTKNKNYYTNLSIDEQRIFFNKIKENFNKIIEESCGIEKYKELVSKYKPIEEIDFVNIDELIEDIDRKIAQIEKEQAEYEETQKQKAKQNNPDIPESLKGFVYVVDGKIYPKQKLPKELEKDYELFIKINDLSKENTSYEISKEYDRYAKLYEERFGKKAYIAEPSGTKEQAIKAIKKCLERNEDILDEIYYPNKNVYYSDKFTYQEGEIEIISPEDMLHRKVLSNLIENWTLQNRINVEGEKYIPLLDSLKEELNKAKYIKDNRFYTYGRRETLRREFTDILDEKIPYRPNRYFGALMYLEEYIKAESSFFNPSELPSELRKNFHNILMEHNRYNKLGIICEEEKNILLDMINEFKDKI